MAQLGKWVQESAGSGLVTELDSERFSLVAVRGRSNVKIGLKRLVQVQGLLNLDVAGW